MRRTKLIKLKCNIQTKYTQFARMLFLKIKHELITARNHRSSKIKIKLNQNVTRTAYYATTTYPYYLYVSVVHINDSILKKKMMKNNA